MLTFGDLTEAGFCTMGTHAGARSDLSLPMATHSVDVAGIAFRCCEACAEAYRTLDDGDIVRVIVTAPGAVLS